MMDEVMKQRMMDLAIVAASHPLANAWSNDDSMYATLNLWDGAVYVSQDTAYVTKVLGHVITGRSTSPLAVGMIRRVWGSFNGNLKP